MPEITVTTSYTRVAFRGFHKVAVDRISHHPRMETEWCSPHRAPRDGTLGIPQTPIGRAFGDNDASYRGWTEDSAR